MCLCGGCAWHGFRALEEGEKKKALRKKLGNICRETINSSVDTLTTNDHPETQAPASGSSADVGIAEFLEVTFIDHGLKSSQIREGECSALRFWRSQ